MKTRIVMVSLVGFLAAAAAYSQTAAFPGAVATDSNLKVAVNGVQAQLQTDITSNQTTISLNSCNGFAANVLATIDSEIIALQSCTGGTALVASGGRGFDGTTAAGHSAGAIVGGFIDAWHHNSLSKEVQAVETSLGANLINVGSAGSCPPGKLIATAASPFATSNCLTPIPASSFVVSNVGVVTNVTKTTGLITPISGENDVVCNSTSGSRVRVVSTITAAGTSTTFQPTFKDSLGVYRAIDAASTISNNGNGTLFQGLVLENGQCASVNISALGSQNMITWTADSFPVSGNGYRSVVVTGNSTTAAQVLYTSPSPLGAYVLNSSRTIITNTVSSASFVGDASNAQNINVYQVPMSGTPGSSNLLTIITSLTAGSVASSVTGNWLPPGTTLQYSDSFSPSTTFLAYVNIFEPQQ